MKSIMFNSSVRNSLVVALATLASVAMAEVSTAPASSTEGTSNSVAGGVGSEVGSEVGTIPAARQDLPQQTSRGAEGPIREDDTRHADPSVRDSNPMTTNGLWETRPGNQVAKPETQSETQ